MPDDLIWTDRMSPRDKHPDMGLSPRRTEADVIAANNKKPEKSTPSPNDYVVNKEKFLPNLGRGGGSLLSS